MNKVFKKRVKEKTIQSLHEDIIELVLDLIQFTELDNLKNKLLIDKLTDFTSKSSEFLFGPKSKNGKARISTFGDIEFPNYKMGAISSFMYLDYREMAIFYLYLTKQKYYDLAIDLGANIGLHSILLKKAGFKMVHSFEPDPVHFEELKRRVELNNLKDIIINNVAVSNFSGHAEFTRVLGNTTSSHLSGAKSDPYGVLEKFKCKVYNIQEIIPFNGKTFIKIDIEGSELDVLSAISEQNWNMVDCVVEVTSRVHAIGIFDLAKKQNLNIFSQKISWKSVAYINEMPFNYKEGSIFLTKNANWSFT